MNLISALTSAKPWSQPKATILHTKSVPNALESKAFSYKQTGHRRPHHYDKEPNVPQIIPVAKEVHYAQ